MIVLVTGGRSYADRAFAFRVLDRVHAQCGIEGIVHGACGWDADDLTTFAKPIRGADGIADAWARERGILAYRFPARWRRLGRRAGPKRNEEMVERLLRHPSRGVVAFPGGDGTEGCVELARAAGIDVIRAGNPASAGA